MPDLKVSSSLDKESKTWKCWRDEEESFFWVMIKKLSCELLGIPPGNNTSWFKLQCLDDKYREPIEIKKERHLPNNIDL